MGAFSLIVVINLLNRKMAAFLRLQEENRLFNADVFENHKDAESYRELEFRAVIAIQSWYRGLRTRHYLRHINKCAVMVQRTWRGYLGREFCRQKLDAAVKKMMLDFYNDKATKTKKDGVDFTCASINTITMPERGIWGWWRRRTQW